MNRHIFRGSKVNRDRRERSFERAVIGEAWRRHLEATKTPVADGRDHQPEGRHEGLQLRTAPEGSIPSPEINQFVKETINSIAKTVGVPAGELTKEVEIVDDKPLGTCPHCGADYHDEGEARWHADFECVGAEERFR